ncbi:MAG: hypothetical protein E6I21_05435 [Chloroflexi bacterium]|nr:MAG: hypothetical protein E6I21_05435 [Chloroflexota bacterium]
MRRGNGSQSIVQRIAGLEDVAKGLTSSGAAASQNVSVHAAPGTVLRQDRESKAGAELPGYILQEITPRPAPRYIQDDPYFIAQFAGTGQKADRTPHTGYRELA